MLLMCISDPLSCLLNESWLSSNAWSWQWTCLCWVALATVCVLWWGTFLLVVQLWRVAQCRSQGQLKERGKGASRLPVEGNKLKSDTLGVKCRTGAILNALRKECVVRKNISCFLAGKWLQKGHHDSFIRTKKICFSYFVFLFASLSHAW